MLPGPTPRCHRDRMTFEFDGTQGHRKQSTVTRPRWRGFSHSRHGAKGRNAGDQGASSEGMGGRGSQVLKALVASRRLSERPFLFCQQAFDRSSGLERAACLGRGFQKPPPVRNDHARGATVGRPELHAVVGKSGSGVDSSLKGIRNSRFAAHNAQSPRMRALSENSSGRTVSAR